MTPADRAIIKAIADRVEEARARDAALGRELMLLLDQRQAGAIEPPPFVDAIEDHRAKQHESTLSLLWRLDRFYVVAQAALSGTTGAALLDLATNQIDLLRPVRATSPDNDTKDIDSNNERGHS